MQPRLLLVNISSLHPLLEVSDLYIDACVFFVWYLYVIHVSMSMYFDMLHFIYICVIAVYLISFINLLVLQPLSVLILVIYSPQHAGFPYPCRAPATSWFWRSQGISQTEVFWLSSHIFTQWCPNLTFLFHLQENIVSISSPLKCNHFRSKRPRAGTSLV